MVGWREVAMLVMLVGGSGGLKVGGESPGSSGLQEFV